MDDLTQERNPGVSRAELERERAGRPLRRHAFVSSGKQAFGRRVCTCGSLERDAIHRVPEVTEEQRAVEARRMGERA